MFIDATDDERTEAEGGSTSGTSIGEGSLVLQDLDHAISKIPPNACKGLDIIG